MSDCIDTADDLAMVGDFPTGSVTNGIMASNPPDTYGVFSL
jgi:hypothetical protein